jgi:hypothetical protein
MRNKEALAILKPYGNAFVLNRIRFEQEIKDTTGFDLPPISHTKPKELDIAIESIELSEYNILKSDIELMKSNEAPTQADKFIPPLIVPPLPDSNNRREDGNVNISVEQMASFPSGE